MNISMPDTITTTREYRDLGDSWPKAIRSTIEFKARLGWQLRDLGWALIHAGDKLNGDQPTSLDAEWAAGRGYEQRTAQRKATTA